MAKSNGTTKAQVAPVQIGGITIEGIMLPDGSFGVSAPQIVEIALDKPDRNKAAQKLKRICKKHDTQVLWGYAKTGFNKHTTLVCSLEDCIKIIIACALSGNEKAITLCGQLDIAIAVRRSSKKKKRSQYCYLISDGEYLKIGITSNIKKRIIGIQCGNPREILLVGARVGGTKLESQLHKKFWHHHVSGEWFLDKPEIRAEFDSNFDLLDFA